LKFFVGEEIQLGPKASASYRYLEKVKQLSGGGNASYTDLLKTKVQLSNAEISYEKSRESSSLAKYTLAELLGGTIDTAFIAVGTLNDSSSTPVDSSLQAVPDSATNSTLSLCSTFYPTSSAGSGADAAGTFSDGFGYR